MTDEDIIKQYESFQDVSMRRCGNKSNLDSFLEKYGHRIAACPLSTRDEPGSLVQHNLKVAKAAILLNKKFNLNLSEESVIFVSLFRNVGMIGGEEEELLVPQDSDWHQKRGELFKYNDKMTFMRPYDRSIQLLSAHLNLTEDEHLAILTSGGNNDEYNKFGVNALSFVVYAAMRLVAYQEEQNKG